MNETQVAEALAGLLGGLKADPFAVIGPSPAFMATTLQSAGLTLAEARDLHDRAMTAIRANDAAMIGKLAGAFGDVLGVVKGAILS